MTCQYAYTGAEQTFTVPAGVSAIDVDAIGGHGGDLPIYRGGAAGHVSVAALAVTPGATLYVEVGGNGRGAPCDSHQAGGGWNGGGNGGYSGLVGGCNQFGTLAWPGFSGGGASDIRTATLGSGIPLTGVRATDPRLLVAGGGGGSADLTYPGGNAGVPSSDAFNGNGADGQTKNSYCNGVTPDDCHFGGYGGTQIAAGAGGVYGAGAGGPGYGGSGATGPSVNQWWLGGGGGGGGWFGGGGGGSEGQAAGVGTGGGGSDMVPAGGTVLGSTHDAPRATISYTLPPDLTGPTAAITAPVDGATVDFGQNVAAAYSCADDDSGIATCAGTLASGDPIDTATLGEHAFTVAVTDAAGNAATKVVHYTVVDTVAPTAAIAGPLDGATFTRGQAVAAGYTCADAQSGIASCIGSVPSGAAIDTSTAGSYTLTVTATDKGGNTASAIVGYSVVERPAAPATATTTPPAPAQAPLARPAITRGASTKAAVSKTGSVTLPGTIVTCPRGAGACRVVMSLRVTIKRPGHKTRAQTLKTTRMIAAVATSKLKQQLPASLRQTLADGAELTVNATLTASNAAGRTTATKAFRIVREA